MFVGYLKFYVIMKACVAKMLIKIQNALLIKKKFIIVKNDFTCLRLLDILWNNGFILGYTTLKGNLKVFLKYIKNKAVMKSLKLFVNLANSNYNYSTVQNWKINSNKNFIVFSTNLGLKTLAECKKLKIAGKPYFIIN